MKVFTILSVAILYCFMLYCFFGAIVLDSKKDRGPLLLVVLLLLPAAIRLGMCMQ